MRQIIRRREIVNDELRYEGETLEPGTHSVPTASQWLATPEAQRGPALLLRETDEVELLASKLDGLRWIVVEFAKPGEGRGFSQARLLRERYGYEGELRARGAFGRDLLFFLARCGFDAFEPKPGEDLDAALGAFDSFSVAYQGGSEEIVHVHERAPGL
jgi:uncharacterized protein (DUF934 family)